MTRSPIWTNSEEQKCMLRDDGWVSPDTYDNYFESIIDGPAVYLFRVIDTYDYLSSFVGYVGMSERLSQRLSGHEVYREIQRPGVWPQRWFKPTPLAALREVEDGYIKKFDPPWNVQGRVRGVDL